MSAVVSITAIGSFRPDSSSSRCATRRLRCVPLAASTENTAAASVDATMAPSSSASGHSIPNRCAASAVIDRGQHDAECREQRGRPDRFAHRVHRRVQPAVEQDQNERRRPDLIGEMIILEWDLPDPFRAGEHADRRESPSASGTPSRAEARLNVTATVNNRPNAARMTAEPIGSVIAVVVRGSFPLRELGAQDTSRALPPSAHP